MVYVLAFVDGRVSFQRLRVCPVRSVSNINYNDWENVLDKRTDVWYNGMSEGTTMLDFEAIAQRKETAARRLKAAFYGIRKQNIPRLDQSVLEKLAECVSVSRAYQTDCDTFLPYGRPTRSRVRHGSKKAVVFREAHRAVVLYWDLIRTDEVTGLEPLIERLEHYADFGYEDCELLGGDVGGYTLLIPYAEED